MRVQIVPYLEVSLNLKLNLVFYDVHFIPLSTTVSNLKNSKPDGLGVVIKNC